MIYALEAWHYDEYIEVALAAAFIAVRRPVGDLLVTTPDGGSLAIALAWT